MILLKRFSAIIILSLISVLFISSTLFAQAKAQPQKDSRVQSWAPVMSFIENKGQFDGRNWQPSPIEYGIDYNGLNVFFTKKGLTYRFDRFIRNPKKTDGSSHEPTRICLSELASVSWLGTNNNTEIMASDKIEPYYSYAINDKASGEVINKNFINGYTTLVYKNLYNNIDAEYVCHSGQGIKYNLYLYPGADASQIGMKYEAFHSSKQNENIEFELTPEGNFRITGSLFEVSELKPVAYYEDTKEAVDISFTYKEGIVGFKIANYNKSRTLVIDPWIVSPTFTSSNAVWEVETDNAGNVYAIGGESPMKLNKYNSGGTLQWTYNTPWDTSGYWLGTMATDNSGITYVTAGTSPKIQKVSTAGTMVWNNSGPNGSCEYWSITFNCDNTKLIVGGTYVPSILSMSFSSVVYDINVSNGNVLGFQTFDTTNVMGGIGTMPVEIRGISASHNAKYNFLTHNAVGLITQNIGACPTNQPLYKVPLNYTLGYKCENYLPATQNGGGLKAIISNDNYVYTHSGSQIHKRDLSTGALITSVNIPGGQNTTALGAIVVKDCGLDVDDCGNIYAGSSDRVVKFDQDLNILAENVTGFAVYDVSVNTNGEVVAVGAVSNNSASIRNGKISSINMACCAQYDPSCCDATICPTPPMCHNVAPISLVANTPGGVWSGTGITGPTNGTFDPSVAGPGTHTIVYTLPCGSDSITIVVNYCATLAPCVLLNGDVSVQGGIGPYTWEEWIPASNNPITNQTECTTCGYSWNMLLGQCMNGMMPVSTCNSPAHWSVIGTGNSITPPSNYPIQVTDSQGNSTTINDYNSLPICSPCPTIDVLPSNITNVMCGGDSTGSFDVTVQGGMPPYNFEILLSGTPFTTVTGVTSPQSFTGLPAGSYTINIYDNDSCPGTATAAITEPLPISFDPAIIINAVCGQSNGAATVNPVGGTQPYNYNWSTNPPQTTQGVPGLAAGSYSVTVTDDNGCSATTALNIVDIGGPTIQITNIITDSCSNGIGGATVEVTDGVAPFTYEWSSTPPQTIDILMNVPGGTYTVTVTDSSGCTAVETCNIPTTPGLTAITSTTNEMCGQGNGTATVITTGGSGVYIYLWSNNENASSITDLSAGSYNVTISDGTCTTVATAMVGSSPGPNAGFTSNPTVVTTSQGPITFSDNSSGNITNWVWIYGDNSPNGGGSQSSHQYQGLGTFTVTLIITDVNGCTDTAINIVRVIDDFTLYIPNAFTPDGDGLNDGFTPHGQNVDPDNFEMYIFDRWGQMMYHTTKWGTHTAEEPWNGTKYNEGSEDDIVVGVYVYRINVKEIEGYKHVYIGSVTLIK